MKIDGDIERFAADPGSRELPMHTRSVYNSKGYSLVLALKHNGADAEPADDGVPEAAREDLEGSVTLRDAFGRVVYEGTGLAQCAG
jgi:hypothetical protein